MPSTTPAELYQIQSSSLPTRPSKHLHRPSSCQNAEQATIKVASRLSTKTSTSSSQLIPMSPSSSPDGRKVVHWTGDIVDSSKPTRTYKSSSSSSSKKPLSSSSSSSSKRKSEKPNDARRPPPAPRPHRLPSPDLSDFGCGNFCDCYSCQPQMMGREDKMSRQLEAARRYISDAKGRGY